ncbi:MAG: NosD domain-containing protein [bacterium]
MPVDSAQWYPEATANYTYGDGSQEIERTATDSTFMPYSYPNTGRFQNVVLETTHELIDGRSYPSDHVSMCDVNGVMHHPPCSNPVTTSFSTLNYGVLTYNTGPTNAIKIEKSAFTDNRRGIYLGNADYATVTANSFQIPVWTGSDTCYGLYLGSCTGYHVEGNEFNAPNNTLFQPGLLTPIEEIGLIVDNSGGQPNEIYRNYFENLDIAINAQRVNRYDPGSGGGE